MFEQVSKSGVLPRRKIFPIFKQHPPGAFEGRLPTLAAEFPGFMDPHLINGFIHLRSDMKPVGNIADPGTRPLITLTQGCLISDTMYFILALHVSPNQSKTASEWSLCALHR